MRRIVSMAILGLIIGFILIAIIFDCDETSAEETNLLNLDQNPSIAVQTCEMETAMEVKDEDIDMLAKLIWGEARGVKSETQRAAVVWCVLNRVDSEAFPDTISEVITQPNQFYGYNADNPTEDTHIATVKDVLARWYAEKTDETVKGGRILPTEYIYFTGDGTNNYFTIEWKGDEKWGWELPSPYKT